ncbi:DUF429 domain-containing protein [Corynebacterium pilosum]|uniref:Protein of uncharacterized function (DUF429) n=1 Tax=Corynebacterium pilosum TaxID=35756 RepID=A0A376CP89_9CORY|nr:DUF429 domain-containing protein [Corynebacterium pilosum]STC70115.1 Protein of uncharacterised function (DUF429) [Corynebacterium pilosum]
MSNRESIIGVDLAAEPSRTGVAVLNDDHLASVTVGVSDEDIVSAIAGSQRAGIDVPFGWPLAFTEFIGAHARHSQLAPQSTDTVWRRTMALRATDRDIHTRLSMTPLSVSTNLIAYPALRWAGIEARLREQEIDTRRDGAGRVAEVYPAAALKVWGLAFRGYKGKGKSSAREEILEGLKLKFPALRFDDAVEQAVCEDDNALDAVIAALVAREIAQGNTQPPPAELREAAAVEGWIHVPTR